MALKPVWALVIVGQNEEPFLKAALQSVDWVEGYAVINTDPLGTGGRSNEAVVVSTVQRNLRLERLEMETFSFAQARNAALELIPEDTFFLILDADDVHWPDFQHLAQGAIVDGYDVVGAHYWHHCVNKNLWHSQPHRNILFSKEPGTRFVNTVGGVHEEVQHPRRNPTILSYSYHHYGYIKPARDIAARWEFYRSLGAEIHDYDVSQPDAALDDWPRICHPYVGEHPPAVREVLESFPVAVPQRKSGTPRAGLVLTTWNDADNLRPMLGTLDWTTEPFALCVVDNGSTDETLDLVREWRKQRSHAHLLSKSDLSLVQALNKGFKFLMDATPHLDYIGWIHPDMLFHYPDWLSRLVETMDVHPEYVKLGAQELGDGNRHLRAGNSQCYIVRRTALEQVGLFHPSFKACGGYEDWEHNHRLLQVGKVMIWPNAVIQHDAMGTRRHHDNHEAADFNANLYHKLVGQWEAVV